MPEIEYYRDDRLPVFEIKSCMAGVHASRMHAHEELSLGLIMDGASNVGGAGRGRLVKAGDAILIPSGTMHDCRPHDVYDWRFRMLFLKQTWLEAAIGVSSACSTLSVTALQAKDYGRTLAAFGELQTNLDVLEKESLLIWTITRFLHIPACRRDSASTLAAAGRTMRAVADYIHGNYLERMTLDDLAGVANLSKYGLVRGFKRAHGMSPHSYQTMLRINHAKRELQARKDTPIAAVAQEAGFYDQSHFNKAFRQFTGTTPRGYRLGRR